MNVICQEILHTSASNLNSIGLMVDCVYCKVLWYMVYKYQEE